jgi:hypothetical protein
VTSGRKEFGQLDAQLIPITLQDTMGVNRRITFSNKQNNGRTITHNVGLNERYGSLALTADRYRRAADTNTRML